MVCEASLNINMLLSTIQIKWKKEKLIEIKDNYL